MAFSLPPLPQNMRITDANGQPSVAFSIYWERFKTAIEDNVNGINDALEAAGLAQDAADAANAAADTANNAAAVAQASANDAQTSATNANTAASNAQNTANQVTSDTSLQNSYVTPNNIVTATDAGATATINIAAHTRVYGDGTSVSVNAGSIVGAPHSTLEYVYYDQPSRAGGTVSYQFTPSETTAAQTGDRHTVGKVTTPAGGGGPTTGAGPRAPGVGVIP